MKKILLAFAVLVAVLMCVTTGAVIGVAYYQMGLDAGADDGSDCNAEPGQTCDLPDEDSTFPA